MIQSRTTTAFKFLFLIFSIILLNACGGGGGGSSSDTTQSQSTTYPLFNMEVAKPGVNSSFNLSGSDTEGNTVTVSVLISDRGQTTYNNTSVVQTDTLMTFTLNNSTVVTQSMTTYSDPNTTAVLAMITDSETCVSTTVGALPATSTPGNFGSLGTRLCDDGTTETVTWRLEAATDGNAKLIYSFVDKDQFGNIEDSEEDTFTIDENGNVISFQAIVSELGGYVLTMNGN